MIYSTDDDRMIPSDDIDWSDFDPEKLDHIKTKMLAGPLAEGAVPARLLAACLVSFGGSHISHAKNRASIVDLSPVREAKLRHELAAQHAADALAEYRRTLREAYRQGATARALAEEAGLSVPRVNQLVAGAR